MGYLRTTDAATEPVTLTEVKAHLSIDSTDWDTLLTALITAARNWAENYTRRAFITQTWSVFLDCFPSNEVGFVGRETLAERSGFRRGLIYLPYPPFLAITTFKYVNTEGTLTTLNSSVYQIETNTGAEARILPAWDQSWPDTRNQMEAVQIVYTAGYGAASAVPQAIKQALLLQVGSFFKNRDVTDQKKVESQAAKWLLDPYRVWRSA